MPLVAGPFTLQPDSAVAVTSGVWDFTPDAAALVLDVAAITDTWADFFTVVDSFDIADELDTYDDAAVTLAISYLDAWADFPNLDYAETMYSNADSLLGVALAFAPDAAWVDPPAPYVPPGSVLNLTAPTVPVNAFSVTTTGTVGDQSPLTAPGMQLWNFTRVGYANFFEGDTFELVFLGNPGQTVSVGGTFNGATLTVTDMGTIDETGKLGLQGVMGPDVVGAWHEDWYLDGVLLKSFDFIVSPVS